MAPFALRESRRAPALVPKRAPAATFRASALPTTTPWQVAVGWSQDDQCAARCRGLAESARRERATDARVHECTTGGAASVLRSRHACAIRPLTDWCGARGA